jgi:hypothetical protein
MNVQTVRATGKSPYSLVFGQDPMCHFSILDDLHQQNIIDEEALPDKFFEDLIEPENYIDQNEEIQNNLVNIYYFLFNLVLH